MTRRLLPRGGLLAASAAVALLAGGLAMVPGTAGASASSPVCGPMQHVLDANGTPVPPVDARQPVLLVHGFNGSPSSTWDGSGLAAELAAPGSGFFVGRFDYSYQDDLNQQWVTDARISGTTGQPGQLADVIGCMAQESRAAGGSGKVIIVAYSLGGLAAQQTISEKVSGREVASDVGGLVSIGTPWQGLDPNFDLATTLTGYSCDALSPSLINNPSVTGDACLLLTHFGLGSPAAQAVLTQPGGAEPADVRSLPKIPAGFPVLAVTGNLSWTAPRFNQSQVYQGSDWVVSTKSATSPPMAARAGSGQLTTAVITCYASNFQVPPTHGKTTGSSLWSHLPPCFHVLLPGDPAVAQRVMPVLQQWQASLAPFAWPPAAWTLGSAPAASAGPLSVIACPAAAACTLATAGDQGSTASFALYTLAHGQWAQQAPVPTSMPNDSFTVTAIACPATADCALAGADFDAVSKRSEVSVVATKSQGTWTTTQLPLPPGSGSGESMELDGLTCPRAGNCVGVGEISTENSANNGAPQPLIAALQGGTWTVALAPLPADASTSPVAANLADVACTAPGSCVAVGAYLPASGGWRPLIETLANGNWTPGTASLPADSGSFVELHAVACPAPGSCVAVGDNTGPVGGNDGPQANNPGVIVTLAHGIWSTATAPQPTGAPGQFWGALWGIACPAPGSCAAVGQYNTDSDQDSLPQIDTLSHGTWTAAITGSLPADAGRKSQYASAIHVACAPTGYCATLADYTNGQGYQESRIEATSP